MLTNHRKPTTEPRALRRERANRALRLILAGVSYDAAATAVGFASRQACHAAVQRLLYRDAHPDVVEYRALENARLDLLQRGVWQRAIGGDVDAVDCVLRIQQRRARLNGFDAPAKGVGLLFTAADLERFQAGIIETVPDAELDDLIATVERAAGIEPTGVVDVRPVDPPLLGDTFD